MAVLAAWVVSLAVGGGLLAPQTPRALKGGGYIDADSESARSPRRPTAWRASRGFATRRRSTRAAIRCWQARIGTRRLHWSHSRVTKELPGAAAAGPPGRPGAR